MLILYTLFKRKTWKITSQLIWCEKINPKIYILAPDLFEKVDKYVFKARN